MVRAISLLLLILFISACGERRHVDGTACNIKTNVCSVAVSLVSETESTISIVLLSDITVDEGIWWTSSYTYRQLEMELDKKQYYFKPIGIYRYYNVR